MVTSSLFSPQPKLYHIELTRQARKGLEALNRSNKEAHDKIKELIEALKKEPRPDGTKKLKTGKNAYRIKYKNYRVVYTIDDGEVKIMVFLVSDRKAVYKELSRLDMTRTKHR